MINSYSINAAPINGLASGAPADPIVITAPVRPSPSVSLPPDPDRPPGYYPILAPEGFTYRWTLAVLMAGVDVTALLSGTVDIDREEGAAGIAGFDLYYPVGESVPTEMLGQLVTIDYISETGGVTKQARRFTGYVTEPAWDPVSRLMSISCSDRLQFRVEALEIAQIDALVGGYWSPDVFDALEGRSRWDYALERLSTRAASLDCSRTGIPRVTSWYAGTPAFIFSEGSTIYQSVSVDLAQLSSATNRIEIDYSYRYSRLWQRNQDYTWTHPGTGGATETGGFCAWRTLGGELPTLDMIKEATEAGGQTLLDGAQYDILIPTTPNPCGDGNPWINNFTDLLLAAEWKGGRRWVQSVTENYTIVLATAAGEVEGSQTVSRESGSFEVEDVQAERWGSEPFTGGSSINISLRSESRRLAAIDCVMRAAHTSLIDGHRQTTVSWSVPTSLSVDCDTSHTMELQDQGTAARGKCRRIVDRLDLLEGSAITTISIAVMRGGGVSDSLIVPASPDTTAPIVGGGGSAAGIDLPTQLGGRLDSPVYDDALDGFSGNYDAIQDFTLEVFPRRLTIPVDEIPEVLRDELVATTATLIRVGIPTDLLEL